MKFKTFPSGRAAKRPAASLGGITLQRRPFTGKIGRVFSAISELFSYASAKSYGFMLLSFGLVTMLLHLAVSYISSDVPDIRFALIVGAACCAAAFLMIFVDRPLCLLMQDIRLTDYLFFELLGIRRMPRVKKDDVLPPFLAITLGVIFAAIGLFISLVKLLMILAALLLLGLGLSAPEFPLLAALLTLPYLPLLPHPSLTITALVLLAALCFTRKVFLGKRILYLERNALILAGIAGLLLLSSAIAGRTSFYAAAVVCAMMFTYPLADNLFATPRHLESAENVLLLSSVPAGLYALVQATGRLGVSDPAYLDEKFRGLIQVRVGAFFGNPNVYAAFLIPVILLSLSRALDRRSVGQKIFCAFVFLLALTDMVLTFCRGAWVALIVGLAVIIVLRARRLSPLWIGLPILLPLSLMFLPDSVALRLMSVVDLRESSIAYRLSIMRSSLRLFRDRLLLGVGVGEDAFGSAFAPYAQSGVTYAAHAHNVFLTVGLWGGVFALILFIWLFARRLRQLAAFRHAIRRSAFFPSALAATASVVSLLFFGATDNIFAQNGMIFLFFAVFGIGSAAMRIGYRDYHEHADCYGEDNAADAAVTDVHVK